MAQHSQSTLNRYELVILEASSPGCDTLPITRAVGHQDDVRMLLCSSGVACVVCVCVRVSALCACVCVSHVQARDQLESHHAVTESTAMSALITRLTPAAWAGGGGETPGAAAILKASPNTGTLRVCVYMCLCVSLPLCMNVTSAMYACMGIEGLWSVGVCCSIAKC